MKISSVRAIPVRLNRERAAAVGTAGSPTALSGSGRRYRRSTAVGALYSEDFETALVKVMLDDGRTGWGEAQAPLAPQVAYSIVELLLRPAIEGEPFDGSPERIAELWDAMYSTMRVRGQTGGFMLDAISGVDLALWDLAGRIAGVPAAQLLGSPAPRERIPAYLSGVRSGSLPERVEWARGFAEKGFGTVKLFHDGEQETLLETVQGLNEQLGVGVAVDALWRLTPKSAPEFGRELDRLEALWLEAPLPPEDAAAHGALARAIRTPVALGESYRTCNELAPFFREGAVGILQPDLGRCGLTEGLRIAALAREHGVPVIPHVSIAMGPQIAAAIHFAAVVPECPMLEFNPTVFDVANRFLKAPLRVEAASYLLPDGPGLGVEVREGELQNCNLESEILYYHEP